MSAIGVDVGGTFIKAARVADDGTLTDIQQVSTGAHQGPDHVVERIVAAVRAANRMGDALRVGIGMPGLVSPDRNTVKYPPNFPGWEIVHLADRVREGVGLPVLVDNDANCAALGEARHGAGRGIPTFILATLGTGVGGGIVIEGNLYRGEQGGAGEIGHTTIDLNGPQCNCGSFGCVEAYVGNAYFMRRVEEMLPRHPESIVHALRAAPGAEFTPALLAQAATDGDAFARAQFYDAGYKLGVALANAMGLLDIRTAIIGGGVAQAGEPLFAGARRAIAQFSQPPIAGAFQLLPAALGNRAGMIGAGELKIEN